MLKEYINIIDRYIREEFPLQLREVSVLAYKIIALILLFLVLSFVLKRVFIPIIRWIVFKSKRPFYIACYNRHVFRSFLNFIPMLFCYWIIEDVFYRSKRFLPYIDAIFNWLIITVVAVILHRLIKAVEDYADGNQLNYNATGIKAVAQSMRIIGIIAYVIISLSIFLRISPGSIFAGLGAMTAVVLLIFRDTILGFISGIHVATSRLFKVGDWINVTKYKLEGNVIEINLLTTKIKNFDNTISSIPTYDLISTEVRNAQVLIDKNSRRIKRSIFFSIKSFKFIDLEAYQRLQRIDMLKDYFLTKEMEIHRLEEINTGEAADEYLINGKQLTNIGTFRMYVYNYLKRHPQIDEQQPIMVRQMEISPNGMPLEIYCFTKLGIWSDFENLQSDIFDHILVAAREFDLDIVQTVASS
ncbi:mechanosensitive ion channel family protein [Edaphocola aurantiacus]|uniref:mechanosensitive ion channel family protein n=1 Tax=Edaphocola aurantiacus TaxID=2601682 RepID=UPI001C94F571|nr:mechanosensitive ion channel domain-containing protein [Edaphocola aurantiacus]